MSTYDQSDGLDEEPHEPWLDASTETALHAVVPSHMPPQALALYARWWQLETWLRELTYVELRGKYGSSWVDAVKQATGRLKQDAAFTHLAGPDNDNPLAYLDYKQVLDVIRSHWPQLSYALLNQSSWDGRQDDLMRIRHRIGHMRRPHRDDIGRIEQILRDLERGAFIAFASYNRRWIPDADENHDVVTDNWVRGRHPVAQRLIQHAELQYKTRIHVQVSRRPWTVHFPDDLNHAPGIFWHIGYSMRDRCVDLRSLWHDPGLRRARGLIVHMLSDDPGHIEFTFSAVDDPNAISDAIGSTFDSVLMNSRSGEFDEAFLRQWRQRGRDVDFRVRVDSGWNIIDETTLPITYFEAGAGIYSVPVW